jgi:predicted metal-dependent hydrolase
MSKLLNKRAVEVAVKKLTKRWGEFHPSKNQVVLNAELIVAPMECIDYVIIHELSHAVILDHGPDFYNLLTRRLPRWKDLKNELEGHSLGFSTLTASQS